MSVNYSKKLHALIPGGAHTYSRGDDQFPGNAPQILSHGKGCRVWDADGNEFLDYGMGLRSVTVGYAYDPIAEAAIKEIRNGNNLTRASLTELKAAETITDLIQCADMVKFAKNGSTVTTAAVKLSRAYTGRNYVAICADHPFFSYDDWFIGKTKMDKGIPDDYKRLTLSFKYNDINSVKALFDNYPQDIAALIMEPATTVAPADNFLHKVRDLCNANGTVFILDEMITGFRWNIRGAQEYFKVEPDLATFGKGMANGFSVAALVGKREIMEMGSILKKDEERMFLISTTHGPELNGLGAFIKTVEIYKELNVVDHIWSYGEKLIKGANSIAKEFGVNDYFYFEGFPCSPNYVAKDKEGNISMEFRTLFSQCLVENKILMPWVALSYSHNENELEITLNAIRQALKIYSAALDKGVDKFLKGEPVKPVFRKRN